MDAALTDTLVGSVVDGRYLVKERIARGGMAVVYRALDQRLERDVALKVMHPDLADDAGFVAKFIDEARSMSRLSRHPDIVTVFDQGASDGLVWIAMELVEGQSLRQVLARHHRLAPADALAVMDPVLNALAAAHHDGIVHRDIKPENVLIGIDGRVQLVDLGLAKVVESAPRTNATREILFGTVAYIAPELALGEAATPRSDVYAAGIVMYELLVGRPPHTGPTDYVIVRRHVDEDVPPPSEQNHRVTSVVDDLVVTATSRDPRERFADASAFRWALERSVARVGPGSDPALLLLDDDGVDDLGGESDGSGGGPASVEGVTGTRGVAVVGTDPVGADDRLASGDLALMPGGDGSGTAPSDVAPAPRSRLGQPQRPHRRRRHLVTFAWLMAIMLLAMGAAAGTWYWAEGRWMAAPNLVGMTSATAEETSTSMGLRLAEGGRDYSETIPKGSVVTTDPGPGERLLREGTITIVLSKGPERYTVPELAGSELERAVQRIDNRNLELGEVTETYDEEIPEGAVVAQDVEPGSSVPPGIVVSLAVSKGPKPIPVTSVVGMSAAEAVAAIESIGLVAESSEEYSEEVARGDVISQRPRSGTLVAGDVVALTVSLGPEDVEVPDVEGLATEDAARVLREAGFDVRDVVLLPAGPGQVLRQSPAEGSTVEAGSQVTIYVF